MGYYVRALRKGDKTLYRVDEDLRVWLWSSERKWVESATSYASIAGAGGSAGYDDVTDEEARRLMEEEPVPDALPRKR